jgi:tight adherence protein B
MTEIAIGALVLACLVLAGLAGAANREERRRALLGVPRSDETIDGEDPPGAAFWVGRALRRRNPGRPEPSAGASVWAGSCGLALLLGAAGLRLVGVPGMVVCAVLGAAAPLARARVRTARAEQTMEGQLAELVETTALAVRGGLSIQHALELAAGEARAPIARPLHRLLAEPSVGSSFEAALRGFADAIGTDDVRLFALIVGIHAKSGGSLAAALDEVATTIRHRIAVRRELRALSAQGRISGAILGALPIAFFLVIGVTSRNQLAPVYRSAAGIGLVSGGLLLEGIAFIWIRRLLRVRI